MKIKKGLKNIKRAKTSYKMIKTGKKLFTIYAGTKILVGAGKKCLTPRYPHK